MMPERNNRAGLPYALACYTIWGFLPLYLLLVKTVPPFEFVAWRILFTVPICLIFLLARRQLAALSATLKDLRAVRSLFLSSCLIGGNWLTYIFAISEGHVYATSLGYYINPLVNVLIGTCLLGEKLTRRQWLAVALAGIGVAILAVGALTSLWVSLTLAITFGFYGLVRRRVHVEALPGLTTEAILLSPPAAILLWFNAHHGGLAFGQDTLTTVMVMFAGVITAVPLLFFTVAARRMDYSLLGFVQFIAPSLIFILGLTLFSEKLQPAQMASFIAIWSALGVFCWDLWTRRQAERQ